MTSTNIIVYDFAVQGFSSGRQCQLPTNSTGATIVLTCAFCDQTGANIKPKTTPATGYFKLVDYYNKSTVFSSSSTPFKVTGPKISPNDNAYTATWNVTCTSTDQQQTFGYVIDLPDGWSGFSAPGQAYNLSVLGAQNPLSLYTTSS
ncbi:MAG: hypothetical protein ACODTL_00715 [Brucella sp.]